MFVNTTAVSAVTGPLKLAPLLWVSVKVLSDLTLPIEPETNTVPPLPAFSVTDWLLLAIPLIVLAKVMLAPVANAPLLVVSKVVLTAVTTASSAIKMELGLLVLTKPPLKVLLPSASVSKCAGAVMPPIAPPYKVAPLSFTFRRLVASRVLTKVMPLPVKVVVLVSAPPTVTAPS